MRATGIVRRLDDLGRVVIPKEIRRSMGVREGDPLEMYVEENGGLVLMPYHSEASSKLRGIADNISNMGATPELWAIADEIRAIAKKVEKIEENA
jgi:AbrB family transcriptional regulator (stage V sporulation protein T)